MQIHNVYYNINYKGLKLINQDFNEYYLKDNNIKRLYRSYNLFKTLLQQNKNIKDRNKRLSYRQIEEKANMSKATFYRYKKLLNTKDWKAIEKDRLNDKHYKPKNLRRSLIIDYDNNKTLLDIIKDIRNKYPTYSKYKIHAILNRDYNINNNIIDNINTNTNINNNINVSVSTIGRIITYLKELRLIKGTNKLKKDKNKDKNNNKLKEKRPRNFNNCYAKPWENEKHNITDKRLNNINKLQMGELIQLDHMVININGIPIRLFNAIDPITKLTVSFGYAGASSRNASLFLKEKMLKLFPFKIKSIQVDGGSENKVGK